MGRPGGGAGGVKSGGRGQKTDNTRRKKSAEGFAPRTYPNPLLDDTESTLDLSTLVYTSPRPNPNSVEANIELLQGLRSALCPRLGPHPLAIATALGRTGSGGQERSQGDLMSILCDTMSYELQEGKGRPPNQETKSPKNRQWVESQVNGIVRQSQCAGCRKSLCHAGRKKSDSEDDMTSVAFVISLPTFDPMVATVWIDRLMVSVLVGETIPKTRNDRQTHSYQKLTDA